MSGERGAQINSWCGLSDECADGPVIPCDVHAVKAERDAALATVRELRAENARLTADRERWAGQLDEAGLAWGQATKRVDKAEAERDALAARFPCDERCDADTGPIETCSRHGRTPRDLWRIVSDQATALAALAAKVARQEERIRALEAGR